MCQVFSLKRQPETLKQILKEELINLFLKKTSYHQTASVLTYLIEEALKKTKDAYKRMEPKVRPLLTNVPKERIKL